MTKHATEWWRMVTPTPGDIDLLDYAVLMTLRQGGQVWPVDQEALAPAVRTAAILRY